jgi:hypothetical protein
MKRASLASAVVLGAVALAAGLAAPACGSNGNGGTPGGGGVDAAKENADGGIFTLPNPDGSTSNNDDGSTGSCTGLQCQIDLSCPNGGATTISGVVYDPAGNNPLYNVVVYVPNTTPDPLTPGVDSTSCSCDALYTGQPVAAAVTDATGSFTIKNAPTGTSIPLVIQIGKWRKQTTVPAVASCTNTAITTKLTLPSSQAEGDIPSIAISTGGADSLECLLLRIGVSASEYGPGASGTGRIHIFQGSADTAAGSAGAATTSPVAAPLSSEGLWNSSANLMPYDITILSCEGEETEDQPGNAALKLSDQQNLLQYTSAGGRVFASHFHYAWFDTGPFGAANIATWTRGANPINDSTNNPITNPTTQGDFINANIITTFDDGGTFPKGAILDQWLANVSALNPAGVQAPGELHITGAKHNADLNGLANTPSQGWIAADTNAQTEIIDYPPGTDGGAPKSVAGATEYLSFNTPVDAGLDDAGEPAYCGRVVYSDLHVGAASGDYGGLGSGGIVPSGCANNPLSPQEKALEFMLFDLSSCVTPDTGSGQQPPPIIIK